MDASDHGEPGAREVTAPAWMAKAAARGPSESGLHAPEACTRPQQDRRLTADLRPSRLLLQVAIIATTIRASPLFRSWGGSGDIWA
jgi:hypothetical protein